MRRDSSVFFTVLLFGQIDNIYKVEQTPCIFFSSMGIQGKFFQGKIVFLLFVCCFGAVVLEGPGPIFNGEALRILCNQTFNMAWNICLSGDCGLLLYVCPTSTCHHRNDHPFAFC